MSASPSASNEHAPLWPWLQTPLLQALPQLRSHAALVHGPEGVGQFEFALALARAWLCESSGTQATLAPACGRCTSCHLIHAGSHPDLLVILPEALQASLGWQPQAEEGEGSSSSKTRKPSQEIKVEAIRTAVQFSQQTASRGRAKVVLVYPVDRMNLVAANTLLKTLEEPPGQVRFVLSGATLEQLLPTVRSRCQAWHLPLPAASDVQAWLQAELGKASAEDAHMLLAAAGGQPLTARSRAQMGLDAKYWPQIPKDVAQGKASALGAWPLPLVVETLQKVCHDLACTAVGSAPRYFPPGCLPAAPTLSRLTAWDKALRQINRQIEHPWQAALKAEALLIQARAALTPSADRKL